MTDELATKEVVLTLAAFFILALLMGRHYCWRMLTQVIVDKSREYYDSESTNAYKRIGDVYPVSTSERQKKRCCCATRWLGVHVFLYSLGYDGATLACLQETSNQPTVLCGCLAYRTTRAICRYQFDITTVGGLHNHYTHIKE